MTQDDLKALARDLGEATKRAIEAATQTLHRRISDLERDHLADEARIKMLEARPTLEYKGVWNADASYAESAAVSHRGCIWISKTANHGVEPPAPQWQLAVKKGRDAR